MEEHSICENSKEWFQSNVVEVAWNWNYAEGTISEKNSLDIFKKPWWESKKG